MISLPYKMELRAYQIPLWKATVIDQKKRAFVVWPRRNGKDLMALNILIARAMQRKANYLYLAPFQSQVRKIIWEGMDRGGRAFLDYIPPELIADKKNTTMQIRLANGSLISFGGSDNVDSLMGGGPAGIVLSDYSLHKDHVWDYLRPILAENGGWSMANGTPRGMNFFYTQAQQAKTLAKVGGGDWFYEHLTRDDTGFPSLEAIQAERDAGMPESLIEQEFYTSFMASSEDVLIPLDIIKPCVNFELTENDIMFEPKLMGIDPAFAVKGDYAVFAKRQGRKLHPLQYFRGVDPMLLADKAALEIQTFRLDAVMVDAGRGEGVIAALDRLGYGDIVIPVNFQGTRNVDTERYLNMRAKIWCRMRDWFADGVLKGAPPSIPNDQDLITGLSTPTMFLNDRNQIQLESKQHIRSRGVYMMDGPDAVAVTFAEEVEANFKGREAYAARSADRSYDPLRFLDQDVRSL